MILILLLILFLLMAGIGGERGANSFLTLVLNALIGIASVYAIALGLHPLLVMIVSSFLFTEIGRASCRDRV